MTLKMAIKYLKKKQKQITSLLKKTNMSTSRTATEQLHTQTNAEESIKTTSSLKQINEEYDESGIYVRGNDDTGYAATIGNYRITDIMKTSGEVVNYLNEPDAGLVTKIFGALIECWEKDKAYQNKINGE